MRAEPIDAAALWADLQAVRRQAPLVHNITNFVVMNYSANALLAVGASPVMAHAKQEVKDMVGIAQALVLNIGTLEPDWVEAMLLALQAARTRGVPVVLDPVGAGATPYRNAAIAELLRSGAPSVVSISCNALVAPGWLIETSSAALISEPCSPRAISRRSCRKRRREKMEETDGSMYSFPL